MTEEFATGKDLPIEQKRPFNRIDSMTGKLPDLQTQLEGLFKAVWDGEQRWRTGSTPDIRSRRIDSIIGSDSKKQDELDAQIDDYLKRRQRPPGRGPRIA